MSRILSTLDLQNASRCIMNTVDTSLWTCVIPAAGEGTRLSYNRPKVLYPILGKPILHHLVGLFQKYCSRFVIDPLTGLKAFDRRLLNKLDLKSNGVELETEIIARLSQAQKYILEVPVEYQPRLKSEGKKITIRDGLQALLNLLKMRFLDRR